MDTRDDGYQLIVSGAQQVLREAWGHPVRLRIHNVVRSWGRHTLLSCRVKAGPGGAPDFVIVKAVNGPDGDVRDERAALELLAGVPESRRVTPDLYGASPDNRMLVIEDVGAGPTLSQLLRSKAAWAEETLVESMSALAAIHSATRGLRERYDALHMRLGGDGAGRRVPVPGGPTELRDALAGALTAVGRARAELPEDELREIGLRMAPPASLQCLVFIDQCPPNRIVADGRLRFVDLELATFRHPFLDGAFPLIGHFNCMDSLRLRPETEAAMLAAYRTGLASAYPELADTPRFGADLSAACALWLLWLLRTLPDALERDRVVGFMLVRSRQRLLAVLAAFIEAAESFDQLPKLLGLSRRLHEHLSARWAGSTEPLPHFPIFGPAPPAEQCGRMLPGR